MLRSSIRKKYPEALSIIQSARNVAGHVQRKINEVQGLAFMHNFAALCQAAGDAVDWTRVKKAVMRTKPPFADSVDDLVAFLAAHSGGLDGNSLKYVLAFHRQVEG